MKRLLGICLSLCLVCSALVGITAFAEEDTPITVVLNDVPVVTDVASFIRNDRTMVGLRGVFEQMGAKVSWDGATRTVTITNGTLSVQLVPDQTTVTVSAAGIGQREYELDVAPILKEDRTFVPLRFVAETFECIVGYYENEETSVAYLYTPDYDYGGLQELFEQTYGVTPIDDPALPEEENTCYYELDPDVLLIPFGQDHLQAFCEAMLKNGATFSYDDITGYFSDGTPVCNAYEFEKYQETLSLSVVADPRRGDSSLDSYLTVADDQLEAVGTPVIRVSYECGEVLRPYLEEKTEKN